MPPADAANRPSQVLGLSKPQDGVQISTGIGGHGESNRHNGRQELGDVDGACRTCGGAGPQTAILGQLYNEPPANPVSAERA